MGASAEIAVGGGAPPHFERTASASSKNLCNSSLWLMQSWTTLPATSLPPFERPARVPTHTGNRQRVSATRRRTDQRVARRTAPLLERVRLKLVMLVGVLSVEATHQNVERG